jgi:hypothetical protein
VLKADEAVPILDMLAAPGPVAGARLLRILSPVMVAKNLLRNL